MSGSRTHDKLEIFDDTFVRPKIFNVYGTSIYHHAGSPMVRSISLQEMEPGSGSEPDERGSSCTAAYSARRVV
jgi:hypothetical protein